VRGRCRLRANSSARSARSGRPTVDEDGVAAQHGLTSNEVNGRTLRVAGGMQDRHGQLHPAGQHKALPVGQRGEGELEAVRRVEVQGGAGRLGQLAGARDVVGVQVGVEDPRYPPPLARSQGDVELDVEGGIDGVRLATGADQVRRQPLPRRRTCTMRAPGMASAAES
jgi:hypothetical protein